MRLTIPALMMILVAPVAWAATASSWAALDETARKTCERGIVKLASKAKISRVTGKVIGIGAADDTDRYYALLLDGKTAGFASQWLCLYDKRAKTAVAREIEKQ